ACLQKIASPLGERCLMDCVLPREPVRFLFPPAAHLERRAPRQTRAFRRWVHPAPCEGGRGPCSGRRGPKTVGVRLSTEEAGPVTSAREEGDGRVGNPEQEA